MEINKPAGMLADDAVAYKQIYGVDNYNKTIKCTYFLVVLFSEGSGVHYIDDKEYPIGKKQLHFLFPGQHHHWVTGPETNAQKIVIGKKVFESFSSTDEFHFIRHNLNPVFKLTDPVFNTVNTEMEAIERDLNNLEKDGNQNWKDVVLLRMGILASMMKREAEGYIKSTLLKNSNATVRDFWDLINQHYTKQKVPKWYADKLCITPNYLTILCKKHLNTTASDMIHLRVMQEAKRLLRLSDKSIKEISFGLGFDTISHFSGFFKKKSSFSPTEYRGEENRPVLSEKN